MSDRAAALAHCFVVPDLNGPISGGTLFNRELVRELAHAGVRVRAIDLDGARAMAREGTRGDCIYWVDSLYLDELAGLRAALPAGRIGLLLHSLPSLLAMSDVGDAARAREEAALGVADLFLCPSAFMRALVRRLPGPPRPTLMVEPGRLSPGAAFPPPASEGVRAVMVANLLPGKGIHPLLLALGERLLDTDRLSLCVVGSATTDVGYAGACQRYAAQHAQLSSRVAFVGALLPQATIERMAANNLMVSASYMEAYGMAIAEAKTLGVPIVARAGGHVAALVDAAAGGEVVETDDALAQALVQLCRIRKSTRDA